MLADGDFAVLENGRERGLEGGGDFWAKGLRVALEDGSDDVFTHVLVLFVIQAVRTVAIAAVLPASEAVAIQF